METGAKMNEFLLINAERLFIILTPTYIFVNTVKIFFQKLLHFSKSFINISQASLPAFNSEILSHLFGFLFIKKFIKQEDLYHDKSNN